MPARTTSASKKAKIKATESDKTTPKRLAKKDSSVAQLNSESNDMKILDTWKGLKIVKVKFSRGKSTLEVLTKNLRES